MLELNIEEVEVVNGGNPIAIAIAAVGAGIAAANFLYNLGKDMAMRDNRNDE